MLAAGRLNDVESRIALQQINGFEIELIDSVNLTRHHSVGTGGNIVDDDNFNSINPSCVRFPVALIACETRTHTGLEAFKDERTCTNRLVKIGPVLRDNEEVVIGRDVRQIGIAAFKRDLDLVITIFATSVNAAASERAPDVVSPRCRLIE